MIEASPELIHLADQLADKIVRNTWSITNRFGSNWDYLNPKPEDVDFHNIAVGLSRINRFCGQYIKAEDYSVAQHTVEGLAIADSDILKKYWLLHDAHEAYMGDAPTPFKHALKVLSPKAYEDLKRLENISLKAIHQAAGLPFPAPLEIMDQIKIIDSIVFLTEVRDLFAPEYVNCFITDLKPMSHSIEAVEAEQSRHMYISALYEHGIINDNVTL